jgi:tetratricopeptide (TPR) repeat protein
MLRMTKQVFLLLAICIWSGGYAHGQDANALYLKGVELVNAGKPDGAKEVLSQALSIDPQHEEARYLRAFIYLNSRDVENALSDYAVLLKANPNHKGALTNRALLLMEIGEYAAALKDLNRRVGLDPKDPAILFDRAYCHGLMGAHEEAIEDFSAVIRLDPQNKDAYANRGFSRINLLTRDGLIKPSRDEAVEACEDFKQAKALGDTSVDRMIYFYCPEEDSQPK